MKNYIFGYARVSTGQQNLDRQLDVFRKYGCDMIYNEKMTGTRRDRPGLAKMLDRVTEGDTVVIESLSCLGRNTKDLIELTELFEQKSVRLISLKEQIDTSTSTGKLLFTLMSAIAQFERDVIADRTCKGLRSARVRGRTGGRPKTNPNAVKKAVKLYKTQQHSIKEIEELTGGKNQRSTEIYQKINYHIILHRQLLNCRCNMMILRKIDTMPYIILNSRCRNHTPSSCLLDFDLPYNLDTRQLRIDVNTSGVYYRYTYDKSHQLVAWIPQ